MPSNENLFLDAFGGESQKQAREVNQGVQYLSNDERTKLFQDGFGRESSEAPRPHLGQSWRIRCDQVGTDGGHEFSIGPSTTQTMMSDELEAFNFTVDLPLQLRVEQIGMVSAFGAIVTTRLF